MSFLFRTFLVFPFLFVLHFSCAPPQICTPKEKSECTCSENTKGTKTCSDDGSTYSACSCPNQEPPKEYSHENKQEEMTLEKTLPDERFSEESPKEKTSDAGYHEENTQVETPTEKHPEPEQIVEKECTLNTTRSCYNGPTKTNNIGECKPGQQICSKEGAWSLCLGQILPTQELCNGKDDDCNGQIDDTYPEKDKTCETQKPGICKDGVYQCLSGLLKCKQTNTSKTEECNNIDDDCDGQIDEELKQDCYSGPSQTEGVGTCKKGEQTCTAGKWGLCSGEIIPQSEVCNGKDDDCNGIIDQSYAPKLCPANQTCETGVCLVQCKEDADCPNKTNCQNGLCKSFTCQSPLQACVHTCIDVSSNAEHCGACYQSCSSIQACSNSACVCDLNTAQICNGVCTDVSFNDANCGTCGTTCTNGTLCVEKKCTTSWAQNPSFGGSVGFPGSGSITSDTLGNIYIAGVFEKAATFGNITITTPNWDTTQSAFLAKLNKHGQWLWAKRIIHSTSDSVRSITTDDKGNLYISGIFQGTATFGSITLNTNAAYGYIAKMDTKGQWLWAIKTSPSPNYIKYYQNAVYITGSTSGGSFGSITPKWYGSYDIFVAKMDTNGKWLWAQTAGGTKVDSSLNMYLDGSGNIYISGSVEKTASFGTYTIQASLPYRTSYAAKLDKNGNWLWAKTRDYASDFSVDKQGNMFVSGSYTGSRTFGTTTLTATGKQDLYVGMLDTNGTWKWVKSIGTPNATTTGMQVIPTNNALFVIGSIDKTTTFGSLTADITKGQLFVAKIDTQGNWLQIKQDGFGSFKYSVYTTKYTFDDKRITMTQEYSPPLQITNKTLPTTKYYPMLLWSFSTF